MRDVLYMELDEKAEHEKKFGRFNHYPPNWKPIDSKEFWRFWMVIAPATYEYRQMREDKETHEQTAKELGRPPYATEAKLFTYSDGTGLAFVQRVEKALVVEPALYQFAVCEHEYVGVPEKSRMCYHVSRCTKCGREQAIDSSD